jgi:hypothetical protein
LFSYYLFFFLVLAFFDFSSLRTHFWPFTDVMRKIRREVTRKVVEAAVPAARRQLLQNEQQPGITRLRSGYGGQAADVTDQGKMLQTEGNNRNQGPILS